MALRFSASHSQVSRVGGCFISRAQMRICVLQKKMNCHRVGPVPAALLEKRRVQEKVLLPFTHLPNG